MIRIENVKKSYGAVEALRGVSLRVEKGAAVGLLGQNGAGKTTLLNILAGYLAASAGTASIGGHDVLLEPTQARALLGYLPEHPPLYDEMTVTDYLGFCAAIKGVAARAIARHVAEIVDKTGLGDMRRRLIGNLSKGYRQRVGFAQALCGDPEVLVLDEPTSGLDPLQIVEIRALVSALREGHTILFSSHMLPEVQQLCSEAVILHRGRVALRTAVNGREDEISLHAVLAAPAERLLPALSGLGGVLRVEPDRLSNKEQTAVQLFFRKDAEPEKALFTLLCAMGVPILELKRGADTLEGVFLRAISEE